MKTEFIKDADQYLTDNNIDILIYSPTITAGVSILHPEFQTVFGIFISTTTSS